MRGSDVAAFANLEGQGVMDRLAKLERVALTAKALRDRMRELSPLLDGAFVLAHVHGMRIREHENWVAEASALDAALGAL